MPQSLRWLASVAIPSLASWKMPLRGAVQEVALHHSGGAIPDWGKKQL